MEKLFLSGNEAIARGIWEAGVHVATAYPGTPSTEILEAVRFYKEIYCEWSSNEKVAVEVAQGASMAGARSFAAMKHVGVNVAMDPLSTFSYTGVNGGFVFVSADEPGMHSSQNEQDNRYLAKFMLIPLIEPADSAEAKAMAIMGFDISEMFCTPVMLRTTTRVSHSKGIVEAGERKEHDVKGFEHDWTKWVVIPANARKRRTVILNRLKQLEEYSNECPLNYIDPGSGSDAKIGIIASSIAYAYAKDVFPDASYLKLGFTNPLPFKLIAEFAKTVDQLIVLEELEPFMQEQLLAAGFKVLGKEIFPREGEILPEILLDSLKKAAKSSLIAIPADHPIHKAEAEVIKPTDFDLPRPPTLCPGCPHRASYYSLRKYKPIVTGDIGCYTLGVLPPLSMMDTCICMGASVTNAVGAFKGLHGTDKVEPVVATIGDSTFIHSGITGLVDAVYNQANLTVIIMDNGTTAMTGGQQHPAMGKSIRNEPAPKLILEDLCRSVGVRRVTVVDPYDFEALDKVIAEEIKADEPSVIITRRECVLDRLRFGPKVVPYIVDQDKCVGCKKCIGLGCPAIVTVDVTVNGKKKVKSKIVEFLCTGCSLCAQICPVSAISIKEESK
ncbi:MAG: indolepyruvate ferredoxin oxidoreductase subunit alpha [Candidatus Coatesbacteria bacterium]|nr:indolepyruvate ferredoxin oxidoreductase subunit alpha [Candidatus Coatesbacteria bacterium]